MGAPRALIRKVGAPQRQIWGFKGSEKVGPGPQRLRDDKFGARKRNVLGPEGFDVVWISGRFARFSSEKTEFSSALCALKSKPDRNMGQTEVVRGQSRRNRRAD